MYPINVSVTSFGYMMFYIVKIHAKMSSLRYRAGLQDQDTYYVSCRRILITNPPKLDNTPAPAPGI